MTWLRRVKMDEISVKKWSYSRPNTWFPIWHPKASQIVCLPVDRILHFLLCLSTPFVLSYGLFSPIGPIVRKEWAWALSNWSLTFSWSFFRAGFSPGHSLVFQESDTPWFENCEEELDTFFGKNARF